MQLNNLETINTVATKAGFAIFEIPEGDFAEILPKAYHAKPNDKGYYGKEDIDEIAKLVHGKQQDDLIIVLENAETINEKAANAFLKCLEEPGDHIHFIFLVHSDTEILPTIKSRAHNYYMPKISKITDKPEFDEDIMALAKKYIAATPQDLPKIAADIAKDKDDARSKALKVVDAAIQLMYKSYFVTGNKAFIIKLDKLLAVSDALTGNGNIKLQLVAGML
jgi:DNA polymerase III delta prime subunit